MRCLDSGGLQELSAICQHRGAIAGIPHQDLDSTAKGVGQGKEMLRTDHRPRNLRGRFDDADFVLIRHSREPVELALVSIPDLILERTDPGSHEKPRYPQESTSEKLSGGCGVRRRPTICFKASRQSRSPNLGGTESSRCQSARHAHRGSRNCRSPSVRKLIGCVAPEGSMMSMFVD